MIASAKDGGRTTPRERAELLAAVPMFGSGPFHPKGRLDSDDQQALLDAALEGVATAAEFLKLSWQEQEMFLVTCVLTGSADLIGFEQALLPWASLSAKLQDYLREIVARRSPRMAERRSFTITLK
jgi:hypothetical protein